MKKTDPKSGDEMSNAELAAELTLVMKGKRRPSTMKGYVEEVELPNGHIWRKKKSGAWCRFSIKGFCLLGQKTDPLIESLLENDLQKSVSIAEFLQQNPQGGTPQNIDHIIQSLETTQIKQQLAQLEAQGFTLLYRGQGFDSLGEGQGIISPIARSVPEGLPRPELTGVDRSKYLYDQLTNEQLMKEYGGVYTNEELSGKTARMHYEEFRPFLRPPLESEVNTGGIIDSRLGGMGIPTSRLMGITANPEFATSGGLIYVIKAPTALVTRVPKAEAGYLYQEQEHIILHEIPESMVYGIITPDGFPPGFKIDDIGETPTNRLILTP